jgi:hypothetical protein
MDTLGIIQIESATHCDTCGAEFVYIEHPLRRGVPMMAKCECPPPTVETIGATTIITTVSRPRPRSL